MKFCAASRFTSFWMVSTAFAAAENKTGKALDIYVVDVEGGNAVLFVTPAGDQGDTRP